MISCSRHDRTLKFRKQDVAEGPPAEARTLRPTLPPDPADVLPQVLGAWTRTGEDCDTDNYFDPPADMGGRWPSSNCRITPIA